MTDKSGGFSFDLMGVGKILKDNKLAVPPHQRNYAWTKDEVEQLIDDLDEAKAINTDYFLGTVVTIKEDAGAALQIVDGQQRLTTITIFLSAIRNFLKKKSSTDVVAQAIETNFLTIIDLKMEKTIPRLTLNIDDNNFFEKLISSDGDFEKLSPTRESHDLLLEAAKNCEKRITKITTTYEKNDIKIKNTLKDWIEYIEHKATIILLSVSDGSRAFKMFETLNDRGLQTSQADLVKSYLFGKVGKSKIPEAQAHWLSMQETLQKINDDGKVINFLWHSLIATKEFAKLDEVYETISKQINSPSDAIAYLIKLKDLAKIYVDTYSHDSGLWTQYSQTTRNALQTYQQFDPKPVRPLILAMAAKMPKKEIEKSIVHLLSITVRSVITSQTRSGTVQETYASAALSVYTGKISTFDELKIALFKVSVPDNEFKIAFSKAKSSKSALGRYYLHALEATEKNETEPWYIQNDDPDSITLEHIMPKNKDTVLNDWPNITEDEHRRNLKRLGNLCLLKKTQNSEKKNTFKESKAIYSSSPYKWTNMVSKNNQWTVAEIDERQAEMAEIAVRTWPI